MAKNLSVPVLRIEEHIKGEPIKLYGEVLVPMSEDSIKVMGGDPFYDEGDSWLVQWWEGYNQDAIVDLYVVYAADTSEHGDGFAVGNPTTTAEYEALVQKVTDGQWQWVLELMGDWDIEGLAEDAGVGFR